jgi:phosphatidate cytidylyltransferase
LSDGDLQSEFASADEISLPIRRFNIPSFRLRSAQVDNSIKDRHDGVRKGSEQEQLKAASTADESAYIPSDFASRKEKILRTRPERCIPEVKERHLPISRIGTGIGLGVVVLLAFHFGTVTALGVVVIAITLALIEFYDTVRLAGFRPASLLGIAAVISLLATTYLKGTGGIPLVFAFLVVASMLWYLFGVIKGEPTLNISITYLGVIWIGGLGSFAALLLRPQDFPHANGIAFLLGAIIVTVADDTVAYFFGSVFGSHKLAVEISPSKSWEGLIAGSCASVIVGALVVPMIAPWTPSSGLVLGIVVAVISPLGDLSESMIKRDLRIKDMGKLLPGHGGMLDRIDGLLFVLPAVYYLLKVLHIS